MSSGGGGSTQESKTVYEPGRKTLVQSYTPLYIQQAMADQANTSARNLERARQAYSQTMSEINISPGAGFKAPVVPQYEIFDATKYLPSQEFLAQGRETINQEQKEQKKQRKEKRQEKKEANRNAYLNAVATNPGSGMSRMMRGGGLS